MTTIIWLLSVREACYSPLYIPRSVPCTKNLNASGHQFQQELINISDYLQVT